MESKAVNNFLSGGLVSAIIGIVIATAVTFSIRQHEQRSQNWPRATATIVKATFVRKDDDGGYICWTDFEIRYEISGKAQSQIIDSSHSSSECDDSERSDEPAEGEQWEIAYNPSNPQDAFFTQDRAFYRDMRNIRLFALAWTAFGVLCFWIGWREI